MKWLTCLCQFQVFSKAGSGFVELRRKHLESQVTPLLLADSQRKPQA